MKPPLSISDFLVIVASSGCGMWLTRFMLGASVTSNVAPTPLSIILLMVVPCIVGALIVGHPAILALHFASRRRATRLSGCEVLGIVPFVTISLVALAYIADILIRDSRWGVVVVFSFANFCFANIVAGVTAVVLFQERRKGPSLYWTEWSGMLAGVLTAAAILLSFAAALSP